MLKPLLLLLICPLVVFGKFDPTTAKPVGEKSALDFIDRELKLKTYDYLDGSKKTSIPRSEYGLSFWKRSTPLFSDSENSIVRSRAENSDAQSQYELGLRFKYGHRDILKNEEAAKRWFKRAAKAGNPDAILELGNPKDISILHRKGNANASFWLASYRKEHRYVDEDIFFGDYKTSYSERKEDIDLSTFKAKDSWLKFLQAASQRDHIWAKYDLGIYYLNRNEFSSDHKKAHDLFLSIASENYAAARILGIMKGFGWGCERDFEQGFFYLLHAFDVICWSEYSNEVRLERLNDFLSKEMEEQRIPAPAYGQELWHLLFYDLVQRHRDKSGGIGTGFAEMLLKHSAFGENSPIGQLWYASYLMQLPFKNSSSVPPAPVVEYCLKNAETSGINVTNEFLKLSKVKIRIEAYREKEERKKQQEKKERGFLVSIGIAVAVAGSTFLIWTVYLVKRMFKRRKEGSEGKN